MKKYLLTALLCACLLLPEGMAIAAAVNVTSTVTVRESVRIKASDKRLLGFNDTFNTTARLGRYSTGMNPYFYSALKDYGVNIPMNRGFFDIDWKSAIGEVEQRGYSRFSDRYDFGMVEWIKSTLAVTKDAEFTIIINVEDTAENIKDLVRFLTLRPDDADAVDSHGTNWAQKRVELGLLEPVRVCCFEFGNEVDMKFYASGTNQGIIDGANQYVAWCDPLIDAVKSVDPNAKAAVLAYTTPHDGTSRWQLWNQRVISGLGAKSDYIAYHYYYYALGNQGYHLEIDRFDNQIMQYVKLLPEGRRPQIYLSEHAIWAAPELSVTDKRVAVTGLRGTLATAEVVNRISNRADTALAVYHCLLGEWSTAENYGGNCWGVLRPYYNGQALLTGVGEYLKLVHDAFGVDIVSAGCAGNIYCNDATKSNAEGNQILTVSAHTTAGGGLNLILVNQNPAVGHNIVLSAEGSYQLEKEVVLTHENLLAENTLENPDALAAKVRSVQSQVPFVNYYVPPQSVVALYLAPFGKVLTDGGAAVTLNGIPAGGSIPALLCENGKLDIDCMFYDNRSMAAVDKATLMILRDGTDLSNIQAEDMLYLTQKNVVRQRVHFELALPPSTESGRYIAYIANKSYGGDSYEAVAFDYQGYAADRSRIADVTLTEAEGGYGRNARVTFGGALAAQTEFYIKVVHSATGEIVYIGKDSRKSDTQEHAIPMPREALSGEYQLIIGTCGDEDKVVYQKSFPFTKPRERVRLLAAPENQTGGRFTFADAAAGGQMQLRLQNMTGGGINVAVYTAVYDAGGKLVSISRGGGSMEAGAPGDYAVAVPAAGEAPVGAVKVFLWDEERISVLADFYIVKQ